MNLAELLANGNIAEFNTSRSQRSQVDLFAADLGGKVLIGADLSGVNLRKADLSESDLTDCNLMKADLSGADGAGLKLDGAMGMKIRLREAWLERADLTGVDFTRGDLAGATLAKSTGQNARFSRAKLKRMNAVEASWHEADLSEASMYQSDFSKADLSRSDLTSCGATEGIFEQAKLDGIIATNANFTDANLTGASLVGARLEGANLSGANLTGANLQAADLSRANLTGAILDGAILTGACLADACLDGLDLSALSFDQVDLTGLDPKALGLSEDQIETLSNYGSVFDPDAALIVEDPVAAKNKDSVAILWTNPDSEETRTVRWAVMTKGKDANSGVLPLSEETVLGTSLLALDDGFLLLILQQRPSGVSLVQMPLSSEGVLGAARTDALKYSPAVNPIYRRVNGHLLVIGMAHRGPTVVLQLVTPDELRVFHSSKVATGRGFMNRHDPVLACKGDVVMLVGSKGPGAPVRTPEGFPGNKGTVTQYQGKLVAFWHVDVPGEERTGMLQAAELGGRQGLNITQVHKTRQILSLDATSNSEGIWVAWIQAGTKPLSTEAYRLLWPSGEIERLNCKSVMPRKIRFGLDIEMKTGTPGLVITGMDDEAIAMGSDGAVVGQIGG